MSLSYPDFPFDLFLNDVFGPTGDCTEAEYPIHRFPNASRPLFAFFEGVSERLDQAALYQEPPVLVRRSLRERFAAFSVLAVSGPNQSERPSLPPELSAPTNLS